MKSNNLINMKLLKQENDVKERKTKLPGIIFTRACCCLGIVIFHYFCHSKGKFKLLLLTANSTFGFMFVTSFFCISGVVLYYNYPKIQSLKRFYYKRWKSILLPYYICFIYFFLRTAFNSHKLFYKGNWIRIFITLTGLDGYLSLKIKTYYLIGEWFLGAIIIIYIIYPIILFQVSKNNIIINNVIICLFYFLMYKKINFSYPKTTNIITCITSFYFGMEALRFKNFYLTNKKSFIISCFLLILLCTIKIKINIDIIIFQIQGFSLFIILYQIGLYVMETKWNLLFNEISNLSYGIFLFHHKIIVDILSLYNPIEWHVIILLLLIIIFLTIICAKIHSMVVNSVVKSYLFKIIDMISMDFKKILKVFLI